MVQTVSEQIDNGKTEINFHLNIETIKHNSERLKISMDVTPREFLKSLFSEDVTVIEKRTESLKAIAESKGLDTQKLKALLKAMGTEEIKKLVDSQPIEVKPQVVEPTTTE